MGGIRPISWRLFDKFLLHEGCILERESGDHRIYWKHGICRPIVVPKIKDVPVFIIKNNLGLLKISSNDFLEQIKNL